MENNTGKILAVFTLVVFMFFIYEVMTNTSKVNQLNIPNINEEQTFNPKISISDNSITKQDNIVRNRRNNNNNYNNNNNNNNNSRTPINVNVSSSSSSSSSSTSTPPTTITTPAQQQQVPATTTLIPTTTLAPPTTTLTSISCQMNDNKTIKCNI